MKGVSTIAGLLLALAVAAVLVADPTAAQPTPECDEMKKMVATCVNYVTGRVYKPSPECCHGVQRLHAATSTTVARREACKCLKEAAIKVKGIQDARLGSVPADCSVTLSFRLSTKIDCRTVP